MNAGTLARWFDWRRWTWLARTCVAGLLLADISLGDPVPGFSGRHLVLLVGSVLAALTWIAWLPERAAPWIRLPVLIVGMVGPAWPPWSALAAPPRHCRWRSASWPAARLPCWKVPR